jgi:hypothetical protein
VAAARRGGAEVNLLAAAAFFAVLILERLAVLL